MNRYGMLLVNGKWGMKCNVGLLILFHSIWQGDIYSRAFKSRVGFWFLRCCFERVWCGLLMGGISVELICGYAGVDGGALGGVE